MCNGHSDFMMVPLISHLGYGLIVSDLCHFLPLKMARGLKYGIHI